VSLRVHLSFPTQCIDHTNFRIDCLVGEGGGTEELNTIEVLIRFRYTCGIAANIVDACYTKDIRLAASSKIHPPPHRFRYPDTFLGYLPSSELDSQDSGVGAVSAPLDPVPPPPPSSH
jgi:hypothetical protein